MIYLDTPDTLVGDFLHLLAKTRDVSLAELHKTPATQAQAGKEFETFVYDCMVLAASTTRFDGHVVQTGPHSFPDIIARKYFGVEVKVTTSDKWTSTGNSVLETTRSEEVQHIYLFFGKLGGAIDIQYRSYAECLYDVGVTHSPRYKIDMGLAKGASIFDKMHIPYDVFRASPNAIGTIKEYYRRQLKPGEELWWIDQRSEDAAVSPIITPFRHLSESIRRQYIAETMILFPEIFGNSSLKFERPAAYLITNFNAVSSNLRDIFTAGGQVKLSAKGRTFTVPRLFLLLSRHAIDIKSALLRLGADTFHYHWLDVPIGTDRVTQWCRFVDNHSKWHDWGITPSEVFEAALQ